MASRSSWRKATDTGLLARSTKALEGAPMSDNGMADLEKAFIKFKNKYYAAVQTDTLLGQCDDNRVTTLEKKARLFWEQANDAEREFKQMLGRKS
jgi:hypothetical protein